MVKLSQPRLDTEADAWGYKREGKLRNCTHLGHFKMSQSVQGGKVCFSGIKCEVLPYHHTTSTTAYRRYHCYHRNYRIFFNRKATHIAKRFHNT
ncbi:hypothetical protein J6590_010693 [Homalodisca vitripennis]|nr:hypothetical protein J6590_010693 [Homalodisca vitripennis]